MRRVIGGVKALLGRRRVENELDEELRAYLDAVVEEKVRAGLPREAANRAARIEIGSLDVVKEHVRDVSLETRVASTWRDVRYAARALRKSPAFSVVAVLTLALGIGATTGIFAIVEALLLRNLPVRDPQRLVVLLRVQGSQAGESFSYPQVRQLAAQDDVFLNLGGFSGETVNVGPPDALEQTGSAWVSGGYYETLGLVPVTGRLLSSDDDRPGAAPVAVITDDYWARKFGRDSGAVGQSLLIEGVQVAIVGVTPPGFTGTIVGQASDITLALSVLPRLQPERSAMIGPGARWLKILARPREGVSHEELKARLALAWSQYMSASLPPNASPQARARALSSTIDFRVGATGSSPLRSQFRQPLLVLMGVVGLVLVIACVNVANLLLARATARQREIAVRLAIGASRARVVRQLFMESALLAAAGAGIGLVVAAVGSRLLVNLIAGAGGGADSEAIFLSLWPNWSVMAFATLLTVSSTLIFGLAPAVRATGVDPYATMSASSNRVVGSRGKLASVLVTAQVSISLLLLVGAGLFVRTLWNLRTLDRGFRHEGVLFVDVDARRAGYEGERLTAFNMELLDLAQHLPGVTAASLSSVTPLMGGGISMPIAVNGQPISSGELHFNQVAPRYFETLGTPLILGRDFARTDDGIAPPVAIVNEAFVREYMPGGDSLGQRVSVVGSRVEREVVGVVKDAVYETLRQLPPPTVYVPYQQGGRDGVTIEISATGSLPQVASAIRALVEPRLAGKRLRIRTLTAVLENSLIQERLMATLAGAFGMVALVLAAVGLYGLLAYAVVRRTNEIGIRVALGARPSQVLALILGSTARMLVVGIAIGLAAAWAASRAVSSLLFGLTPNDPGTIVLAIAVLVVTGLLAAYLPTRRGTRIGPLAALRCE